MSVPAARTLLATLRLGGGEANSLEDQWEALDPRGLAETLSREGAALWLWHRIRELGLKDRIDPHFRNWLDSAARRIAARNLIVEAHTDVVVRFLTERGAPFILLKGAALHAASTAHPYADARATSDVDVLVPENRVGEIWDALVAAGYTLQAPLSKTWHHLPTLANKAAVPVELHRSIMAEVPASEVWRRMSVGTRVFRRGDLAFVVPSATELLWHAFAHALTHDTDAFRLRHFLDVAALWFSTPTIDWTEIHARLDGPEIRNRSLAIAWLGATAWLANRTLPEFLDNSIPPFRLERMLAWRIAVHRQTRSHGRVREKLLEEGVRAECGLGLTPSPEAAAHWKKVRRGIAAAAARGIYRLWCLRHGP